MGDLFDLEVVLNRKTQRVLGEGRCSALVKVLPNNKDIYFTHNSWTTYCTMLRTLKKFSLNYHPSLAPGNCFIVYQKIMYLIFPSD